MWHKFSCRVENKWDCVTARYICIASVLYFAALFWGMRVPKKCASTGQSIVLPNRKVRAREASFSLAQNNTGRVWIELNSEYSNKRIPLLTLFPSSELLYYFNCARCVGCGEDAKLLHSFTKRQLFYTHSSLWVTPQTLPCVHCGSEKTASEQKGMCKFLCSVCESLNSIK